MRTSVIKTAVLGLSKGEARRMVQNGGVKIAGEKLADPQSQIEIKGGDQLVVQVGKRKFFKVNF